MTLEKDEILDQVADKKVIVAVSGGVDSVVLLDILSTTKNLVVAHADHGMREDSGWTARFVQSLAENYGIAFRLEKLNLGRDASENSARQSRYEFLMRTKQKEKADFIATAHHRDDIVETMIFNVLRGTNRRGLTSLKNRDNIIRPLLGYSKKDLYRYATENQLEWLEDESNRQLKFSRNKIRLETIPRLRSLHPNVSDKLINIYKKQLHVNKEIDKLLESLINTYIKEGVLSREAYAALAPNLRKEMVLHYLRNQNIEMRNIGREDVLRIDDFIVSAQPAKKYLPTKQVEFSTTKNEVKIATNTVVG